METQTLIEVDLIKANPYQPRDAENPDVVTEIATSIKQNGLMQVPLARQVNGHYELAFGHTRLAAFKQLGEACMPLIIRQLSDLEMFELGVAENIKRRDLNVIEQAKAMRRYMDDFGKSSVEAGEFFNTSSESVRSMVRYLNLPGDVQAKLANGEITQTTARTLLSLQKLAPAEVISQTVERFGKKDRFGFDEDPEEVIEDVMESLPEVKEMWPSWKDGKPRGGSGDAWLLDMKNFPNKFLPMLTPVDAAIALGIQDDEAMMEKVSTWIQASLGELPDLDTETLGIPEPLALMLDHLINPPACKACPFYSVVEGTHYCGMETCFNRKTIAWGSEKLRAASKDLGIDIYNKETDGAEYRVLEETWSDNGKKHLELFQKRSKDLRLALASDIDRKKTQSGYQGVPSGSVVMLVGKTLKTLLETGQKQRAEKRSKEQAAALLSRLRSEKREALDWELAGHIKVLFDTMNLAALRALWDAPGRYSNEWQTNVHNAPGGRPSTDDKESVQEDFVRRLIAYNMVRKIGGYYNKSISEYASDVIGELKSWGVKLPRSLAKLATEMDQEIAAATAETED
jgi:ParB/RepB/Spo0J family partition protein